MERNGHAGLLPCRNDFMTNSLVIKTSSFIYEQKQNKFEKQRAVEFAQKISLVQEVR